MLRVAPRDGAREHAAASEVAVIARLASRASRGASRHDVLRFCPGRPAWMFSCDLLLAVIPGRCVSCSGGLLGKSGLAVVGEYTLT